MAGVINKFNLYFKNLYLDYYEVFKDVRKSARARPLKAAFYGASTIFALNLFRTNENLRSYNSEVISALNRIGSVTEESRNPSSDRFLKEVGELNGFKQLRQLDLGFSTIIYKTESNPEVALYRYNCKHLNPSIIEFFKDKLVDFGLMGHWLHLELKMNDYDVNDEEYSKKSLDSSSVSSSEIIQTS